MKMILHLIHLSICLVVVIMALLLSTTTTTTTLAFSPSPLSMTVSSRRIRQMKIPSSSSSSTPATTATVVYASSGLEVVEEEGNNNNEDEKDPYDFDSYKPVPEQTVVCIKDTKIGTGEYGAGDEQDVQVLTIKYLAKFIEDGRIFDNADAFVCKTGSEAILPGFEEGLKGMKVGGKRIIRIPPNKGYGDKWFKGTIPPNSHLEFDCELIDIASTPQEMFMVQLNKFGVARSIGLVICGGYLILSPFIDLPF